MFVSATVPDNSAPLVLNIPLPVKRRLQKLASVNNRSETALAEEVIAAFVDEQRWAQAVEEGLKDLTEGRSSGFDEFMSSFRKKNAARRRTRK